MQLQFSHLCSAAYDLVSSDMLPAQNNDDVWVFMRDLPPSNVYGAEPLMRMIDKARRPWVGQCSYDPETRLVGVLILWDQLPPRYPERS